MTTNIIMIVEVLHDMMRTNFFVRQHGVKASGQEKLSAGTCGGRTKKGSRLRREAGRGNVKMQSERLNGTVIGIFLLLDASFEIVCIYDGVLIGSTNRKGIPLKRKRFDYKGTIGRGALLLRCELHFFFFECDRGNSSGLCFIIIFISIHSINSRNVRLGVREAQHDAIVVEQSLQESPLTTLF